MAPVQFDGTTDQIYFVGDLSPRLYHLEALTSTHLVVDKARETEATITHIKDYLSLTNLTATVRAYFEHRSVGLIVRASSDTDVIGVIEAVDFQKREFSICCKTDAAEHACAIQFGNHQIR